MPGMAPIWPHLGLQKPCLVFSPRNSSSDFHVPHTVLCVLCLSLTRYYYTILILQKKKLRLRDVKYLA